MRHRDLWPKIVPYENNKYPQELVDKLNLMIRDYGFCHDDESSLRMGYGAMADHGKIISNTRYKIGYEFLLNYEAILWISRKLKGSTLRFLGNEKSKERLRQGGYDKLGKLSSSSTISKWSEREDIWISFRNDMLCPPNFKFWVNIDIKGNEKFIAKTRFHGIREKATP
jgi:hypothetical protein